MWSLSDDDERRTKQVVVEYRIAAALNSPIQANPASAHNTEFRSADSVTKPPAAGARGTLAGQTRLYRLLDETSRASWLMLALAGLLLGAAHAIQPGHGKTLVTAVALGPGVRFYQPALLGLTATLAHCGSVLLIAAFLWYTGETRVASAHHLLTKIAGFAIGAAGLWRIGRSLGGYFEHDEEAVSTFTGTSRALIGLGLAGGVVPCWDAVALLLLAAALGRLAAGVALVLAFSAGMAVVLVAVGVLAMKLKKATIGIDLEGRSRRILALACGGILAAIGCFLFFA
jgi:ABC-type nickel/cobalt efflux system permease component RcnA